MQIKNIDRFRPLLKTIAGKEQTVNAVVESIEGDILTVRVDNDIRFDIVLSDESKIKKGSKLVLAVESGDITLAEANTEIPATAVAKSTAARSCSRAETRDLMSQR